MKRVLLTCARIPTALFLARTLHKAGAEVHIADPFPVHICKATNAVKKCHEVTSPHQSKTAYKKEILDIISTYNIDVVIPIFEEGYFLAEFYDEISSKSNIIVSDINLILQLHNKFEFIMLANKLGLPTPTTYKYDFIADNFEYIKKNKYIVKKIFSRSGLEFEIFEAGAKINPALKPNGEHIIQEFIQGQMICTCSYVYNGKLLLHSAYKQLICTPNGAASICFQAIDDPRIQKSIESFVAKIGYSGWISFDIIQKPNGDFFYIECNPRLTFGLCLFNPKILAQTVLETNSKLEFQDAANIGAKAQMTLVSLECVIRRLLRGALQPKELQHLFSSRDLVFDLYDLNPFIYQFLCYFYVKYKAAKLKTNFLNAAIQDLTWN